MSSFPPQGETWAGQRESALTVDIVRQRRGLTRQRRDHDTIALMAQDEDLEVRIVVAAGILPSHEALALHEEAAHRGQGLFSRLFADRRISDSTLASLRANMTSQANDELSIQSTMSYTPGPDELPRVGPLEAYDRTATPIPCVRDLADPDGFPVPGWERYEPIRLLGQGGMGRVFLARDLRLDRNVAIKFVRNDDPELARRIVDEARAQARVNDDRVCKVYEVGEVRGRVYIAMQHIDGRPLSELASELTIEQKAIVVRGAALGVAEAHRVGLIHRDLKPSNILVERGTDGTLRPFVVDFGLAREWAESTTMTGTVLGTPQFMAPEQARGEVKQLDRRADVYSLGATLYTALVGRTPIEGPNQLAVLTRVAVDEPPSPRTIDRDVPIDLEAITMKCLQKQRADRYDSARALADDLGRFLGGEPVAARSTAGLGYRLRRQLRRHARLVAGVSVAIALVAVAAGYAVREHRHSAERVELARRFTERVERIEAMARYSALAPAHDTRPDRARLRHAMDELADEVRASGELALGPGHYALGRGYLALGDDDRAAADLTTAWQSGFCEPRVAYALALAEGHLYQRGLHEIEQAPSELRDERRRELARRYRDPALGHLRDSLGPDVPSLDYVAALVAYYEERFDDALHQLDAIDRGDARLAWSYEASLLRGEILHARAVANRGTATPAQTSADLAAGRAALAAAAAIGRSDPAVYVAQSALERAALTEEIYGGGDIDPPFDRGVDATGRALAILPDDGFALELRVGLLRRVAEYRGNRGEDVSELLARAVADGRRAIELAPERREGKLAVADAYRYWGQFRQGRSEDPTEQLSKAVEIMSTLPPSQQDYDFHVVLGLTHMLWADYQDDTGQDSERHRSIATDAYVNAIRLDGRGFAAPVNLGINYYHRASQPRPRDADADLVRALEAFDKGRTLNPNSYVPRFYEGEVLRSIAERKQARGVDPGPDRGRAIEMYQQGLAINPRVANLHNGISVIRLEQARDAADRRADPGPFLDQAKAAAAQAVTVAPGQGFGYNNRGEVLAQRAAYERARGDDPRPLARQAEADFAQALERMPGSATFLLNLAAIHTLVATYDLGQGRDPRQRIALARSAVDRTLARDPTSAEAKRMITEIDDLEARWSERGDRRSKRSSPGSAEPARRTDPAP
ncbi:MAG TPA: serine/threonine-protein kinase [Kofleriaceae bacterium]|nr:serine/threonine-protein kinase [Kofleriaceae bacterium]